MKRVLKTILITSALAAASCASLAQPMGLQGGPGHPMMDRAGPGPRGHMGMRERMEPAKMEAYMLKRAAELKAKLKLTASQEGAWTTFAAAMKPPARPTANLPERAELDKLSTPERIDKMHALRVQRTTEINAAMDKRDEAVKTFYAALTPEQQKVFDAEHARVGAQRWQGRGRGPGGPGTASASDAPAKK